MNIDPEEIGGTVILSYFIVVFCFAYALAWASVSLVFAIFGISLPLVEVFILIVSARVLFGGK